MKIFIVFFLFMYLNLIAEDYNFSYDDNGNRLDRTIHYWKNFIMQ